MSITTSLALNSYTLDVTLFIEGVPYVFGTRAGLPHPMMDLDSNTLTNMGATASVSALIPDQINIGAGTLNWETLIMEPASLSFGIVSSSTWDRYFMRRTAESFSSEISYSGTTLAYPYAVTAGAPYSFTDATGRVGMLIYSGRESMMVTDVDTLNWHFTVSRAYADFPGAQHIHGAGSTFSWSPPQWIGRRCEARIWLNGETQRVVYGVIQASPAFDKEKQSWSVQIKDTMSMIDRKIALGFTGGECTTWINPTGTPTLEVYPTEDWRDEVGDNTAQDKGHLLVTDTEGRSCITPILAFGNSGTSMSVSLSNVIIDVDTEKVSTAKRCYIFRGYPMIAALNVLMSKAGGNSQSITITETAQAIGDRLFGQVMDTGDAEDQALSYGQEKRFGAAINKIFLDVWSSLSTSDLAEAARAYVPGFCYVLGLNGEEDLIGLLSEVAHAHGGFWFLNRQGQISFRRFAAIAPGSSVSAGSGQTAYTVTDEHLSRDGSSWISLDDESEAIATQTIECNWDPVAGKYLATFNLLDMATHEAYREKANNSKASRRGLYVRTPGAAPDLPSGLSPSFVEREVLRTQMERVAQQRNRGLRKYNLRLPWRFSQIQPGDVISLTTDHLIDFTGSVGTGLSAFKVLALQVKTDVRAAQVDVECVETTTTLLLPPVLQVASYDAGTKVITLVTGAGLEWDKTNNAAPLAYFDGSAGSYSSFIDSIGVLDESASPPYSALLTLAVASFTATTITLSGVPATAPAAGDLIYLDISTTPPATTANIYGHTMDSYAFGQHYLSPEDMTEDFPGYGYSLWIDGGEWPVRRWA